MSVKTYDPKSVIITIGGTPISGFGNGSFITLTPSSDKYTKATGADGEVGRGKSNDNTYDMSIVLLQTSASNDYFSALMKADKLTNTGVRSCQIIDLNGTTLMFFDAVWIRTSPTLDLSKEVGERTWVFDTAQAVEENIGGSTISATA